MAFLADGSETLATVKAKIISAVNDASVTIDFSGLTDGGSGDIYGDITISKGTATPATVTIDTIP